MARVKNFSITDKGVIFSNVTPNGADGGALTAAGNYTNETEQQAISKFVNCVDIDWNGAEIPTSTVSVPSTINTTGDLVNAIKWAAQEGTGSYIHPEQTNLDNNVINLTETKLLKVKLNANGHVISASEFTADDLKNYLEAGDHINITVNNNKVVVSYV